MSIEIFILKRKHFSNFNTNSFLFIFTELKIYQFQQHCHQQVTSLNSQMFHIVKDRSHNVKVQDVKVSAARNRLNIDGIHVQLSSSVTISAPT